MNRSEDWSERFSIMSEGETDRRKTKRIGLLAGQESAKKWWDYCSRFEGWSLNKIRRYDGREEIQGTKICNRTEVCKG